jgi:hypothetical protein
MTDLGRAVFTCVAIFVLCLVVTLFVDVWRKPLVTELVLVPRVDVDELEERG